MDGVPWKHVEIMVTFGEAELSSWSHHKEK